MRSSDRHQDVARLALTITAAFALAGCASSVEHGVAQAPMWMKQAAQRFEAQQLPERVKRVIYVVRHDHPMVLLEGDFPCMGCDLPLPRGTHRPKGVVNYGKFAVTWYDAQTHRSAGSAICAWRSARDCVRVVIHNMTGS